MDTDGVGAKLAAWASAAGVAEPGAQRLLEQYADAFAAHALRLHAGSPAIFATLIVENRLMASRKRLIGDD